MPETVLQLPPLSLYIHIPWCIRKCPYCDFNSHAVKNGIPENQYVSALIDDLKADQPWVQGRKIYSIFFGGGTPSLFSARAIASILNAAESHIGFEENIEITLEANPGTVEQGNFQAFYSAGINRLSMGIQSFNNAHLQTLGRIHGRAAALTAIESATSAGFDNFNIDLMHGLPRQTASEAESDLTTAIALGAPHISWYQLTIEPNTAFYSKPPELPEDDLLADIQSAGQSLLQSHHLQQYEVSAFALTGRQSQHNLNYWQFGDYLGIGAGAHGKITLPEKNQILRTKKTRQPEHYLARKQSKLISAQPIEWSERPLEFMMNGLRLKQGIPINYHTPRTGLNPQSLTTPIDALISQGLIEKTDDTYRTSALGFRFLNSVLQAFT